MMNKHVVKSLTNNSCFLWHRWECIRDTGMWKYFECPHCGSRKATCYSSTGYQPVNLDWVKSARQITEKKYRDEIEVLIAVVAGTTFALTFFALLYWAGFIRII